jgi:hypothetical protein
MSGRLPRRGMFPPYILDRYSRESDFQIIRNEQETFWRSLGADHDKEQRRRQEAAAKSNEDMSPSEREAAEEAEIQLRESYEQSRQQRIHDHEIRMARVRREPWRYARNRIISRY